MGTSPVGNNRWVNRTEYPFEARFFETDAGRMHYVDEGAGLPLLMVHGTPTWSFLYRHLIKNLSAEHRVIAPDLPGFGLSEKPAAVSYRPEDQARRLEALVEHLGLTDVTLIVHDFGGPIGLSYGIRHPENVRALVLFNTWLWSLEGNRKTKVASKLFGGPIGRMLYKRLNFSARVILKAAYGDKSKLTPEIHRHYLGPFPSASDRQAPWVYARELIGSSDWYGGLWRRADRLRGKPALILWGMKDPTFSEADLERWSAFFTHAEVTRFPDAGHFVQEERVGQLGPAIREFLAASQGPKPTR